MFLCNKIDPDLLNTQTLTSINMKAAYFYINLQQKTACYTSPSYEEKLPSFSLIDIFFYFFLHSYSVNETHLRVCESYQFDQELGLK